MPVDACHLYRVYAIQYQQPFLKYLSATNFKKNKNLKSHSVLQQRKQKNSESRKAEKKWIIKIKLTFVENKIPKRFK